MWQVFVGTKTRRISGHYQALLTLLADGGGDSDGVGGLYKGTSNNYSLSEAGILEKWTSQIEKVLLKRQIKILCTIFIAFPILNVASLNRPTLCRTCQERFRVIQLWMKMVEMLFAACLQHMLVTILMSGTVRYWLLT